MRTVFYTLVSTLFVAFAYCVPVSAGPVLDDLLNYPVVDSKVPAGEKRGGGLGLASKKPEVASMVELKVGEPLGQTFVTGPNTDRLWRVMVGLCFWPGVWDEGESVTFTLYDGPEKNNKLYERTIEYGDNWFKWDTPFDMDLESGPNKKYYFELVLHGGGDGKISVVKTNSDTAPDIHAYIDGKPTNDFDLYHEVLVKNKADREVRLKYFLDKFDYSVEGMEEAGKAYEAGDYDAACELVLEAFEKHMRSLEGCSTHKTGDFDTSYVDMIVDNNRIYKDWDYEKNQPEPGSDYIELDDHVTWREAWHGTTSYIGQNDLFSRLARAYLETGDEKYATKLNELMADYIQDNASPYVGGSFGTSKWVAMHQAWRTGDGWNVWCAAMDSKSLTDDVRLAWIDYINNTADFAWKHPSGGNHAIAVGEALTAFANKFPQYAHSDEWFAYGYERVVEKIPGLFYDDGGCKEPAMNYHGFILANLKAGEENMKNAGLKYPEDVIETWEKALAYTAYMLKPDGQIPTYGDTDIEEFRPNIEKWDGWRKGEAMLGYERFGREDLLYIATVGKKGKRPEKNSYMFPDIGHYILRSGWGGENGEGFEDERYLFLRGGRQGSHGHDDMNQITLYAYGRPLIIDPGRANYGSPLMFELTKNVSHNVLLVGDQRMNHAQPERMAFHTTGALDIAEVKYHNLYNGVDHRRAVLFVRPDYYVVFDRVTGDKAQDYGLNFWLTPPDVTIDEDTGKVFTNEPDGSNILLQSMPASTDITRRFGEVKHAGKYRKDMPVVTFHERNKADMMFATLLYPVPGDVVSQAVNATMTESAVDKRQLVTVTHTKGTDYVFYNQGESVDNGMGACGLAGLVSVDKTGNLKSAAVIEGTSVYFDGKKVIGSKKAMPAVSVEYKDDRIVVTSEDEDPDMFVLTLGRKMAVVNGKEFLLSKDSFKPFE